MLKEPNIAEPEKHHEFQLYLAIEDIEHTKTKAKSPQTNGICERFHRTMQEEFYATAFRKKIYQTIDDLQADIDAWLKYYNEESPIQVGIVMVKLPCRLGGMVSILQKTNY
ncbi:hypothetical protein EZS27_033371 [termite gut metagenome]|uniref:Integrase catalytic domain-containing protein n=1 Tax=termite gut metagenome TaxID=433724 RepID=A0A5J4Q5F6_9ZZZZ